MNGEDQDTPILQAGRHIPAEDLMLYELELLAPDEAQAVEDHLHGSGAEAGCAECREELDGVRAGLGLYAMASTEAVEPPAAGRARLLAGLGGTASSPGQTSFTDAPDSGAAAPALQLVSDRAGAPAPTSTPTPTAHPSRRGNAIGWWGWGIAAMLALVAFHFYQQRQVLQATLGDQQAQVARMAADAAQARTIVNALTDRRAQRVSLTLTHGAQPPQPSGRATYLAPKGTLIFTAAHLQPLAPGKTYELWLIPAGGAAPVAAGTFKPDAGGNATVITADLQPDVTAKAFGVTVEADGGATTPTMPILLAGS